MVAVFLSSVGDDCKVDRVVVAQGGSYMRADKNTTLKRVKVQDSPVGVSSNVYRLQCLGSWHHSQRRFPLGG